MMANNLVSGLRQYLDIARNWVWGSPSSDKTWDDAVRRAKEFAEYSVHTELETLRVVHSWCESEIERQFATALMFAEVPAFFTWSDSRPYPRLKMVTAQALLEERESDQEEAFLCAPQVPIMGGKYRVDFLVCGYLFEAKQWIDLVIECDGHDFHERTKEQAARDRSRDRAMMAGGYHVMRFTGSEIYRNSDRCIAEVENFLTKRMLELRK